MGERVDVREQGVPCLRLVDAPPCLSVAKSKRGQEALAVVGPADTPLPLPSAYSLPALHSHPIVE